MIRRCTIRVVAMFTCVSSLVPISAGSVSTLSGYTHRAWPLRETPLKTNIATITQSPDGYLWFGTSFGLIRFDGVRMVSWTPPPGQKLPDPAAWAVLAGRDGTLWIGTASGLASWKDGHVTDYPDLSGRRVVSLLEDHEGTVWAGTIGTPTGRLCAIRRSTATCYGDDGSLGDWVMSLYEDKSGSLWVGTTAGVWKWKPGGPVRYLSEPITAPHAFAEADGGNGVAVAGVGLHQIIGAKVTGYSVPDVPWPLTSSRILRDRTGALWIGTEGHGLVHLFNGKTTVFTHSEGLSGDTVSTLFEDREGTIWVSTTDGLDRFRESPVSSLSVNEGLSSATAVSVLAGHDGSVWIGTTDGLNRWRDGHITVFRSEVEQEGGSLFEDERGRLWVSGPRRISVLENGRFTSAPSAPQGRVSAFTGDNHGGLWLASSEYGLVHLANGHVIERLQWQQSRDVGTGLIAEPDGGVWVGLLSGGLIYFRDGQVRRRLSSVDGLGAGKVMSIYRGREGAIWAATENGLSRVAGGHVATLTTRNGLPCRSIYWAIEDDISSWWLYSQCGLVRVTEGEMQAWIANSARKIETLTFDNSDGIRLLGTTRPETPSVTKSSDGKIWFAHWGSGTVNVFDPARLNINLVPPPVHIEQIVADDKTYDPNRGLRLPPLVRNVVFDYTALSLAAPEKMHFRYRLEGQDPDWREVINDREVQYSNLPPGNYRFRVTASNNSGVWNENGDTLEFSIEPALHQTLWFQASLVVCGLGFLYGLYLYRLRKLAHDYNVRLEDRVEERTRIARDLHDTLLQTFHGLMLRLQVVEELLPPGRARSELEDTLGFGDKALIEARNAVHDLRSSPATSGDLQLALRAIGEELVSGSPATFRFVVEGPPRDLNPVVRDEIYRITREALRNAVEHSGANEIQIEITYGARLLQLRVRDDGKGIAQDVLKAGAEGHYGLVGMRERAKVIGAELSILSGAGVGTEIDLTIPGRFAYVHKPTRYHWWSLARPTPPNPGDRD